MAINYHHNRRPKNFQNRKVREALPEFYTSDYPKLVTFLEKFYEHLDSDHATSFGNELRQVFSLRDIGETTQLNSLIPEIASGLPNGDNFTDPRYAARRLAELQRHKGTRFAAEEFFRLFFQQAVEIEYPKNDLFIVGQSEIGTESLKFIQNAQLYQVFSILIKIGISSNVWEELYKKFIHPAGFFFAGQITTDTEATAGIGLMPIVVLDSAIGPTVSSEVSAAVSAPFVQLTGLIDSGGQDIRVGLDQLVSVYQTLTSAQLNKFYSGLDELIGVNSFKFDDSDIGDSAGAARPDFSLTTETMDNEMFTRYTSDSAF